MAVAHNGIIENFAELKEELLGRGVRFDPETATEVMAHLPAWQRFNRSVGENGGSCIFHETFVVVTEKHRSLLRRPHPGPAYRDPGPPQAAPHTPARAWPLKADLNPQGASWRHSVSAVWHYLCGSTLEA